MPDETAYIDTSVLGAYYCPESLSAAAEAALRQIKTPVIALLSEVEFCSLLSRKRRLNELTERQMRAILELFSSHVAGDFYRRVTLAGEHFLTACKLLASAHGTLRTLDSLHLAVALAENLPLMTADQDLAKAAKRHKSAVILIK
jgi:predicted nucleic acid-binding protein